MKKYALLFITMVMTFALNITAWASPSFYANSKYDLSSFTTVKVAEIINDVADNPYAKPVNLPEEKLMTAIYKGAKKAKLNTVDVRENDDNAAMKLSDTKLKGAYLQVIISDMSTTSRLEPGYWKTETYYEDYVYYDANGNRCVDRILCERPVWVPPSWHTDAHIDLLYRLYDGETGDIVATSADKRDRTDEDNPNGMLGRSAESFFKSIKKAAKEAAKEAKKNQK